MRRRRRRRRRKRRRTVSRLAHKQALMRQEHGYRDCSEMCLTANTTTCLLFNTRVTHLAHSLTHLLTHPPPTYRGTRTHFSILKLSYGKLSSLPLYRKTQHTNKPFKYVYYSSIYCFFSLFSIITYTSYHYSSRFNVTLRIRKKS